jgi:hypothetical protein
MNLSDSQLQEAIRVSSGRDAKLNRKLRRCAATRVAGSAAVTGLDAAEAERVASFFPSADAEVREVLADYFANDREGWTRGFAAWFSRASATLVEDDDALATTADTALIDYFVNTGEGWKHPYRDWARAARKSIGLAVVETPRSSL